MTDQPGTVSRLPPAVPALTVAWTLILLSWSLLLPTFRSFDEAAHISGGYALLETGEWPGYQELHLLTWVLDAIPEEHPGYQPITTTSAEPLSFAELRDAAPAGSSDGDVNTIGQHPPGYYALLAGFLAVLPDDVPAHVTVWFLRLTSVALLAPLPLLLGHGARRLRAPPAAVVAAAAGPLLVPQLGALGGTVTNDNLLTAAAAVVTVLAVRIATGDLTRTAAVLTGGALAVALLTKAFALVLVPVVVAAYLLAGRRGGVLRTAAVRLVLAGAVATLGGWWWIANLVRYGTVQPAGHRPALPGGPLDPLEGLGDYWHEAVIRVPVRFFASLSIQIGHQPPPFSYTLTTGLFTVMVVAAVVVLARRASFGLRRADAALLLAPFVGCAAAMIAGTWPLYLRTGEPLGLQGRYLFPGFAGLTLVLALGGPAMLPRRLRSSAAVAVVVAGGVFTGLSMRRVLGFHWAERDSSVIDGLRAIEAWGPAPGWLLWLLALGYLGTLAWVGRSLIASEALAPQRPPRTAGAASQRDRATPRRR